MLCEDIIGEILNYCDPKTVTSFHLINRYRASKASENKVIQYRKKLGLELTKTVNKTRKYYKSEILDLAIGDRVTDRNSNYRVYYIDKKMGLLEQVDMVGNVISEDFMYIKIETMKNYQKLKSSKNSLFWATYHYDEVNYHTYVSRLMYGIIKHDYGPIITNINSVYLNHVTKPQLTLHKNYDIGIPEYNMLVTINYKWMIFEYYINHLSDYKMSLTIIKSDKDKNPDPILTAYKVNDKWIIENKKYNIVLFGGWIFLN